MMKRMLVLLLAGILLITSVGCGNNKNVDGKESESEVETERTVEITDANDILTTVWAAYEETDTDGNMYNDKFDIMGGHFESATIGSPNKYDLTQTSDLTLMYCVPETAIARMDDAATMVHLMKATTFTAGAYHIMDATQVQTVVAEIKTQIQGNHWLDGFPDKMLIVQLDEQYVVAAVGSAEVIENFEKTLSDIYGKQMNILVSEGIR